MISSRPATRPGLRTKIFEAEEYLALSVHGDFSETRGSTDNINSLASSCALRLNQHVFNFEATCLASGTPTPPEFAAEQHQMAVYSKNRESAYTDQDLVAECVGP